jgi:hypothetical protein
MSVRSVLEMGASVRRSENGVVSGDGGSTKRSLVSLGSRRALVTRRLPPPLPPIIRDDDEEEDAADVWPPPLTTRRVVRAIADRISWYMRRALPLTTRVTAVVARGNKKSF